jgi:NADH-ubiquinone oxidoreductase chain 5
MISLIIFLPLFSSICSGFFGFKLGTKGVGIITSSALVLSFLISIWSFISVGLNLNPVYITLANWVVIGDFFTSWSLYIDNVTLLMFILVTTVSTLVYLYSLVYMAEDPHLIRFSCYISLFTFFMLILVSSGNLLQLFFGWEGVGLASYLLINFWYTRIQANKAAIQALMVNKLGDIAVLIAIAASYFIYHSIDFNIIFALTPYVQNSYLFIGDYKVNTLVIIAFFLFLGSVGKSAQLGLHTWLPSAMEGPTPVSALIHAATMVTAGIFLIIRCSAIFEYAESILVLITLIGSLTAFFAATIGMLQNDLKRVIAYSTCSQLGYMAFACGLSNYSASFFHLINHGFFKALLFLSAGSIIHGVSDEQDLRRLGGLGKIFPITYCMFLVGSLALMGFPFLSGFFSKDIILETAFAQYTVSGFFAYWLGTLSAFFTAFYSFRLIYLTFLSSVNAPKSLVQYAHESSGLIVFSLTILSLGSIFTGFLIKDFFIGAGSTFLGNSIFILPTHFNLFEAEFLPLSVKLTPILFSLIGAFLAILLNYVYSDFLVYLKCSNFGLLLYSFFNQKWFFDQIYNLYIVKPIFHLSYSIPYRLLDKGFIELIGPLGLTLKLNEISKKVSSMQTGLIYHYTFIILIGTFAYINIIFFFDFLCNYYTFEILNYYCFLLLGIFIV